MGVLLSPNFNDFTMNGFVLHLVLFLAMKLMNIDFCSIMSRVI